MRIWIINDDDETVLQIKERLLREFPKASISSWDNIMDPFNSGGSVDYILIDVSAVCPLMTSLHHAWSPIAKLADSRPGAVVLVTSGIGHDSLMDIVEMSNQEVPNLLIYAMRWGRDGGLTSCIDKIKECEGPPSPNIIIEYMPEKLT